jgi:Fe2+ or Zn2+ uptake regulation protein
MRKEFFIKRLRQVGLKATPQRIALIAAFEQHGRLHPSAIQIYKTAKKTVPSLSLSTTYATLKEFSRLHLIKTLQFDRAENRYEAVLNDHLNLICEKCGSIVDYESYDSARRTDIERRTGFKVTDSRLEFYGLCRNCAASVKQKMPQRMSNKSD